MTFKSKFFNKNRKKNVLEYFHFSSFSFCIIDQSLILQKFQKEILSACSNYKTSWHLLLIISWTVTYCHDFVWIGPWFLHTNNFVLKDEKFGQSIIIRVETRKDYFFQRLRWQFEIKILYITQQDTQLLMLIYVGHFLNNETCQKSKIRLQLKQRQILFQYWNRCK